METEAEAFPTEELWAEYKRTGSRELRDKLIVRYSPLVKYVAGRVSVGLPHTIEQADLMSYGIFGLIDAIEKFDHQRAIKFETYAITRVKGAIIDELRSIDWVPRSVRAKARAIEKAYAKLEAENLRTPTDAEVARELGLSEEELQAQFSQISVRRHRGPGRGTGRGRSRGVDHPGGHPARPPGGADAGVRGRGNETDPGRRHQPPRGPGKDSPDPVLLRGPHAGRDRPGPRGNREPRVPNPHQGGPAVAGPDAPGRKRVGLTLATKAGSGPARPGKPTPSESARPSARARPPGPSLVTGKEGGGERVRW